MQVSRHPKVPEGLFIHSGRAQWVVAREKQRPPPGRS